jgi:hypothetical protein
LKGQSPGPVAAQLRWVKFNEIDEQGHYRDQTQTHERAVDIQGGGGLSNLHPLQVCVVLSWKTNAAARGPGSRGRIYSPRPSVGLDATTGDVAGADRVKMASAAVTLLNSLDASLGPVGGGVIRPVIASKVGEGVNNQIDAVVVDSAMDIQRRRAFQQSRETTTTPVVY